MARYLITGIAGFIGSTLAHTLAARGDEVVGIDNLSTGSLDNLLDIHHNIELHLEDLRDLSAVKKACRGVDYIFHEAALASVPRSIADPVGTNASNLDGTLNVLVAAHEAKVRRLVYAASSSAYGDQPTPLKSESLPPMPLSPYAVQKLAGEYYLQAFHRSYGLETVCLRYFNVFGPRQSADSPYSGVIARFISTMLQGEAPTIFGDGEQSRDFTFVENAVQANLLACHAPAETVAGGVFNVGTGSSQTLNNLYATLCKLLHRYPKVSYLEARAGDILHSQADISLACSAFGYAPAVGFEAGLRRTVDWYMQQAQSPMTSSPLTTDTVLTH